ncbi:exosortase Y-associated Wzy-like protein [Mucilaginibacter lutimaris]|uniref:Exosortase Y-associated Wzy-like protein n=1 Tax=Mucilaginibacter lutimaris TaxID=931629 RepID=A0ABW2ZGV4_9SPHI
MQIKGIERYLALFIPFFLAVIFQKDPATSYLISWSGSFFIFLITLSGWVKPLPNDRTLGEQLMRPLFIMQIIFAGFMSCTSIFYFLDTLGYNDFKKISNFYLVDQSRIMLLAQCQRYYCLAHASFVTGILVCMKYPKKKKYHIENNTLANLLLRIALISFPVSIFFLKIPGLSQFYFQLSALSFIAGTLALAFAIPLKKALETTICSFLYAFNLYQAFHSGFKEPIIISLLVLGVFLYPIYKKLVISIFGPLLFISFLLLPSYVNSFRQNAWSGEADETESSQIALDAALNNDNDESNWDFFVYRLSEVDMFTVFIRSTPENVDYYGATLIEQSIIAIIPRAFWPEKPITENLVMERVYNAGVVNRLSTVSAKPAFVVDAYLSGGPWGIIFYLFLYGAIAQLISIKAESLFGGYVLGSALIFSGLFQILWRGLSFEFLINSVFWSYISMIIIFNILKRAKILKPV